MRDVLFHHRGIESDLFEVVILHRSGALSGLDRLGHQPLDTFVADPIAPTRHRRGVDRQARLEERLATEMLPVRVLGPAGYDGFIGQSEGVLKIKDSRNQTVDRLRTGTAPVQRPSSRSERRASPVRGAC